MTKQHPTRCDNGGTLMRRTVICGLLSLTLVGSSFAAKMTYQQAKQKLRQRDLPEFWVGAVEDLPARWEKLTHGQLNVIAKSPGDRPIHLITYGSREQIEHRANFNSAVGGRDPSAYMDKAARTKPVVFFIGPVHGQEVEGLTGLVNLIHIMETGRDLRDKDQSHLRALGLQCRLLIVPAGNPDGIARFEPRTAQGMPYDEFAFWGMGTWSDDTIAYWPTSKLQHPRVGQRIGFLGCYFNDQGINPMHDEFFASMGPEAPAILRVAMEEGPDLAVSLHSHASPPALLRPTYVPMETQQQVRTLADSCYALLAERGLPHGKPFSPEAEGGKPPAPFNLVSAIYHISGATAFTFECPHGIAGEKACQVDLEQILDIQLTLYESMLRHSLANKSKKDKPITPAAEQQTPRRQ